MYTKTSVAAAVALAVGSMGVAGTASALPVDFTFANNAGATDPGLLQPFSANTEFHVVTPYGSAVNNGDKDVMSGGETWSFTNTTGGSMTAVGNTSTNSGGGGENATLTTGVAGFPVASTAGSVATIQQGASFLQTSNIFTMAAPTTGNIIGTTFGAATVDGGTTADFTQAGAFTINMPVVHTQWATGSYIIGGDPNPNPANGDKCAANGPCAGPGVTFSGTTDGAGNFTMSASHLMTKDEVSVLGFNNNAVEWSLQGSYSVVPVPAAVWLFGSGLVGLAGVARRRRSKA